MSRYEHTHGTDWEALGVDEAVDRAYALGVAASLGEFHPEELEAIREEMESSYDRSVVDLAFEEGKNEGKQVDTPEDGDKQVWNELVEEEPVTVDADDVPTGGRTGIPEAVDRIDVLERPDLDSTEPVDRPSFLERE
jgi:hypothetical protein